MAIELKIVDPPRVELSASGGEHLRFGMDEGTQYRDYNDLYNRPEINGVTLTGDKSGADLGLQDAMTFDTEPTEGSTNPVTSDGIYRAIGGAYGKLYIVTYGVTTYAEIVEAYQSGMFPVMIRGNAAFIMQSYSITGNEIIFSATPGEVNPVGTSYVSGYKVTAANVWSLWTGYFQTINGRVTAISASSTDAQYPTARAVYSALSEKADASDLAGKQDAPLVGTTQTVTYSDMVQAISAGRDIQITHTDSTYGVFTFVDGWVYSPVLGVIGGNGIFNFDGGLLLGQLICTSDGWAFLATNLAKSDDISELWTAVGGKISGGDVPTYEQDPTVPAWAKASTKPTYTASEVGAIPSSSDSDFVHKAGEETITGKKLFTGAAEISRSDSGAILKLKSSAADTNFILERTNGAQCVLESGSSVGLFGTKTNHQLQIRTNYTNRMTVGTDGSVVLATDVAANSNSNQVATTKWVIGKGYITSNDIPAIPSKTSDLTNDSGFVDATGAASAAPVQSVNGQTGNVTGLQPAGNYAAAAAGDSTASALATASIPFAKVDSTSTSTVFTATVPGITEYRDGVSFWLRNGKVTSAAGFTININGLGAKKVFSNMAPTTQDTTLFNVNYTMLFVYCEWLDDGAGGFLQYRGYDANTNTIGYQIRTNSGRLPMKSVTYRYRLFFTAADGKHFVPANNSTSTNATSSRTVCQDAIDPHGPIFYYGTTASVAAGAKPSAAYLWQQYSVTLGYSFNRTGAALVLDIDEPLYIKAAPQADGSAIIDATTPYVQALPTTADGFIYILLGYAYSATQIELQITHPVYHFYNNAIRLWTGPV